SGTLTSRPFCTTRTPFHDSPSSRSARPCPSSRRTSYPPKALAWAVNAPARVRGAAELDEEDRDGGQDHERFVSERAEPQLPRGCRLTLLGQNRMGLPTPRRLPSFSTS